MLVAFITRNPILSPDEFKNHYENNHIPLLQSLAGPRFPLSHSRHYLSRNDSAPDYLLNIAVGQPEDFTYDAFAVLTFENEAAFNEFAPTTVRPEVVEDENKFMVREKMKAVILGEINTTTRS